MTPNEMKAIRRELGLTQAEMARVLCVDAGSVSRYERGALHPNGTIQMVYTELRLGWEPFQLKEVRRR